ncbi:MAG: hypothetical protein DMG21_16310, partial [Acidobacteria bacterium]
LSVSDIALTERLRMYTPGAEVPFTVERHRRRERITVKLDPPSHRDYSIVESPGATPEQTAIRDGWLGSGTSK